MELIDRARSGDAAAFADRAAIRTWAHAPLLLSTRAGK
jgi:hypothetical protein